LGWGQNELERGLVEILKRRNDWKEADALRYQAVFEQILRFDFSEDLALFSILRRDDLGAVTDRARPAARRNDLLEAGERAAAHEQDICGVDLQKFLLQMLAAALRWHIRGRALHELEQRLLHALARDVADDRRAVGLAGNLVDLINVDDAALCALDV
jgi:hypothetical protein